MNKYLAIFAMMLLLAGCATVRDVDGNRYKTVKINGMQWMAENLRTNHYADGSPIAKAEFSSKDTEQPLYYERFGQPDSVKKYGLLYNWYAAVRSTASDTSGIVQGVCPDGWHLPSESDWNILSIGSVAQNMPTSYQRNLLKFLRQSPAGYSRPNGYAELGEEYYWWSSAPSTDGTGTGRYVSFHNYPYPYVCFGDVENGYSVRCVKDGTRQLRSPKDQKRSEKPNKEVELPENVVSLPYKIAHVRSYYSAAENTQVNTYIRSSKSKDVDWNYCIDGLLPTTTFVTPNYLAAYVMMDRHRMLYCRAYDSSFYQVDNQGIIADTLVETNWQENGDSIWITPSAWHYYVPVTADSGVIYTISYLNRLSRLSNSYHYAIRKSMYSRPMVARLAVANHQLEYLDGIGKYPSAHVNRDTVHYDYHFTGAMNKQLDLVLLFDFLDSLYVVHPDGTQERHFFKSRYQQHANEQFDVANTYNHNALNEMFCSQTSYLNILYDSYRDLYYVVVARPMPAVNRDGTRNMAKDKPLSLVILDAGFRQLCELDIPDRLDDYGMMVVPEGLAFLDKWLSDKEKTCYQILEYNEKDHYKSALRAVRQLGGRAVGK